MEKKRFYYQSGFIIEDLGDEQKLIADFSGRLICLQKLPYVDRIIELLNIGFELEGKKNEKRD